MPGILGGADEAPKDTQRSLWLEHLPEVVNQLALRWHLSLGPAYQNASNSWVAPAVRERGMPVVLKVGIPHMEARDETAGLQFWNGDPTVRLLDFDLGLNALLLERCDPGTSLRELDEAEQDVVWARLLRRLWRTPPPDRPFRPLATMVDAWTDATRAARDRWRDVGLVRAGLEAFESLKASTQDDVLLATDLHAGNVLRAKREPWLVIDPKPFVGDRAYDATQHILNCTDRVLASPHETTRKIADLLEVDHERVRLWTFARAASEPRDAWTQESDAIARALA